MDLDLTGRTFYTRLRVSGSHHLLVQQLLYQDCGPIHSAMLGLASRPARGLLQGLVCLSLDATDALGRFLRGRLRWVRRLPLASGSATTLRPGISVIIPERANPGLLENCLKSVVAAIAELSEPAEIIVVVNGSEPCLYSHLQTRYPAVRWLFFLEPLWFCGAVRKGLAAARFPWVYLLNNDMVVDRFAISETSKWRAPHVFAVASQIFFKDAGRRREETGWTNYRLTNGLVEIFDQSPEDQTVRGTLYAGGGASLFQRTLLHRFMDSRSSYEPFYWEDVEWGVRAWKLGYGSLFCPASQVWHSHRATNLKFFRAEQIDRIFRRNGYLFQARNPIAGVKNHRLCEILASLDKRSLLEMLAPWRWLSALAARLDSYRSPLPGLSLEFATHKYYLRPPAFCDAKPLILVVSPYRIYPPAHGGAVRLHHLLSHLQRDFNLILLSDEANSYSNASRPYFLPFCSVHLVGGRVENLSEGSLIARIRSHSHSILEEQLRLLAVNYRPAVVQIEFVELAALVRARTRNQTSGQKWFLTLHDVSLSEESPGSTDEDRFQLELIRQFDQVITCSPEDARLLPPGNVGIVPNGAAKNGRPYVASQGRRLLFVGPFRYRPNLAGIQEFLRDVYPSLKKRIPELELWVLGGEGAPGIAAAQECFRQDGVKVFDLTQDTRSVLDQCTVTINPLLHVRGSCLKVIESLGAGRVCVSTRDGARGFVDCGFPGLLLTDRIQEFAGPLEDLLRDPCKRQSLEHAPETALAEYTWARSAERLQDFYGRAGSSVGKKDSDCHAC